MSVEAFEKFKQTVINSGALYKDVIISFGAPFREYPSNMLRLRMKPKCELIFPQLLDSPFFFKTDKQPVVVQLFEIDNFFKEHLLRIRKEHGDTELFIEYLRCCVEIEAVSFDKSMSEYRWSVSTQARFAKFLMELQT